MGLLADIFGAGTALTVERTDEGVDFSMAVDTPIRAPGSGVVRIYPDWFMGQPYVELTLDTPIDGNRYIYYAEQMTPHVGNGQRVRAGDWVGRYAASGTGLEIGWGGGGGRTLAQATTGYTEGEQTIAGKQFAAALGVPVLATGQHQPITVSGTAGTTTTGGVPQTISTPSVDFSPIQDEITASSMYAQIGPGSTKAQERAHHGYVVSRDTLGRFNALTTFTTKGGR